jgi:circadian clock protein KaiB
LAEEPRVHTTDHAEEPRPATDTPAFVFRLCVAGMTSRSRAAIVNLRALCDQYLSGRYTIEVIDLYQQPELARQHQILATPTLIKSWPMPERRLLGSLSDLVGTLKCLGIATTD